jgi:hypothetical protein
MVSQSVSSFLVDMTSPKWCGLMSGSSANREPSISVLNMLKLMGKHFIDPKRSEILFVFQVFPCTTQIACFWPKLLPALFQESLISLPF